MENITAEQLLKTCSDLLADQKGGVSVQLGVLAQAAAQAAAEPHDLLEEGSLLKCEGKC